MAAYRASVHAATGYTPNYLMLGREVREPLDLLLRAPIEEAGLWVSDHEYVATVQERLRRCYDIARECLRSAAMRRKEVYDKKVVKSSPWDNGSDIFTPGAM